MLKQRREKSGGHMGDKVKGIATGYTEQAWTQPTLQGYPYRCVIHRVRESISETGPC